MFDRKFPSVNGWKIEDNKEGPSRKKSKLDTWTESDIGNGYRNKISLNDALNQNEFIKKFSKNFAQKSAFQAKKVELLNDPFQLAIVHDFLSDHTLIPKLVDEMVDAVEWTHKSMDLYEFYQSTDLSNIKTPLLSNFHKFITNDLKTWMENLTGLKFQKVSVSCSMYNTSNYLLSHDDLLSDRLIAYVFYLTPWELATNWTDAMGGALETFKSDSDGQPQAPSFKRLFPANNQFVFFKVGKFSHHQVGEVLTKDYPRLTIHGWFHGFDDNKDYDASAVKIKRPNVARFNPPNSLKINFKEIFNKNYLKDSIKSQVQLQIEENSEAGLGEFLVDEFLAKIVKELRNSGLKWTTKGPANQQNYELLDIKSVPNTSSLKILIDVVTSQDFFKLLHEYTELDLYGKKSKNPKCALELQRWTGGCYALINDPSTYADDSLDLIFYIGKNENFGVITYLVPDKQDSESIGSDEEDPVLLTIYPQNNFMNLVYRSSGTTKFTKYCYKSSAVVDEEFNYVLLCSYKE